MRPHRALAALLVGLVAAGAVVAVAEGAQRRREAGRYVLVPDLGYVMERPGVEERGWVEGAAPPPKGARRRVVFVGDSVTYGIGVNEKEAWPAAVGRRLNVDAENLAVPGWDAEQVAALVETRIAAWAPDVLVWGTYANDVFPTSVLRAQASGDTVFVGLMVPEGARLLPEGATRRLLRRSALFRRVQAVAYERWAAGGRGAEPAWYGEQVDRVAGWAAREGVPLLIVAIPPHAVTGPCEGAWICTAGPAWHATVTTTLGERDVAWLDALDAWAGKGPFPLPGGVDADHPNAEGHRLLGEAVAERVRPLLPG